MTVPRAGHVRVQQAVQLCKNLGVGRIRSAIDCILQVYLKINHEHIFFRRCGRPTVNAHILVETVPIGVNTGTTRPVSNNGWSEPPAVLKMSGGIQKVSGSVWRE